MANVPYGVQSAQASNKKENKYIYHLQKTYRTFGKLLSTNLGERAAQNLERNGTFVICQSHHYGHQMSFQKYSNLGWEDLLHFSNSGINVNLVKWNQKKISKPK